VATEVSPERITALLTEGELSPVGLLPGASNDTFLCTIAHGSLETYAVYKPRDGEAPLWDFPDGTLYRREMAAFVVASALGWDLVPPTVIRDARFGIGMVQLYIDHDPEEHYFTLGPTHPDVFRRVCALDLLINNADRKAGHCLLQRETGRLFVVDHGVTFHVHPKLRTVIWDYAAEPIPAEIRADIGRVCRDLDSGPLLAALEELLETEEIGALRARAAALSTLEAFPEPGPGRPYPWPPV